MLLLELSYFIIIEAYLLILTLFIVIRDELIYSYYVLVISEPSMKHKWILTLGYINSMNLKMIYRY